MSQVVERPRLYTEHPLTICVVTVSRSGTADDPLGHFASAGFKTQCRQCRRLFAAWDRLEDPRPIPSTDAIRAAGSALLERLGCVIDGDVTCSSCVSDGTDVRSDDLLLTEGSALASRSDWLERQ